MKKIKLSLCLLLAPILIFAQSLERTVIASAGDEAESPELSLSYTVGEAIVETVEQSELILTQGFQQSQLELVMSSGDAIVQIEAKVYPNPAVSEVHLQFRTKQLTLWTLHVLDQNGKSMYWDQFQLIGEQQKVLDCSSWPAGMYFIHLTEHNGGEKTVKLEKLE